MTKELEYSQYVHILNGYSFQHRAFQKKPKLFSLGFYDSRDNSIYESDDLTVLLCLAFFARQQESLLPAISAHWWEAIEAYYGLPIYSENLPDSDRFKAFVKGVEIPNKDEDWFPAKLHLLTSRGTYFQMDICAVLKQTKMLTASEEAFLPPIYSDQLSEDEWWHKAMDCHYHSCPYGSHYC